MRIPICVSLGSLDDTVPDLPSAAHPAVQEWRLSLLMAMSYEPYCDVSSSASGLLRDWDEDAHADWDVASNLSSCTGGETGPGGHNVVPPGTIGAEYRMMKEELAGGSAPARGTPHRDPYHGRTMEPKCAFVTLHAFICAHPHWAHALLLPFFLSRRDELSSVASAYHSREARACTPLWQVATRAAARVVQPDGGGGGRPW